MGGTINGPFDNGMNTLTTSGNYITYPWPWDGQSGGTYVPPSYYWHYPVTPVECSGDVHVFPCPHCDKCKCGKASVKRDAKKK